MIKFFQKFFLCTIGKLFVWKRKKPQHKSENYFLYSSVAFNWWKIEIIQCLVGSTNVDSSESGHYNVFKQVHHCTEQKSLIITMMMSKKQKNGNPKNKQKRNFYFSQSRFKKSVFHIKVFPVDFFLHKGISDNFFPGSFLFPVVYFAELVINTCYCIYIFMIEVIITLY